MNCPQCTTRNLPSARFCAQCGRALTNLNSPTHPLPFDETERVAAVIGFGIATLLAGYGLNVALSQFSTNLAFNLYREASVCIIYIIAAIGVFSFLALRFRRSLLQRPSLSSLQAQNRERRKIAAGFCVAISCLFAFGLVNPYISAKSFIAETARDARIASEREELERQREAAERAKQEEAERRSDEVETARSGWIAAERRRWNHNPYSIPRGASAPKSRAETQPSSPSSTSEDLPPPINLNSPALAIPCGHPVVSKDNATTWSCAHGHTYSYLGGDWVQR